MQARALLINNIIEIAYMKVKIQENFLLITKSQCTMFSHRFYTQWQILQSKWKSFKDWKVKKCTENHEITNCGSRNANDRAVEKHFTYWINRQKYQVYFQHKNPWRALGVKEIESKF